MSIKISTKSWKICSVQPQPSKKPFCWVQNSFHFLPPSPLKLDPKTSRGAQGGREINSHFHANPAQETAISKWETLFTGGGDVLGGSVWASLDWISSYFSLWNTDQITDQIISFDQHFKRQQGFSPSCSSPQQTDANADFCFYRSRRVLVRKFKKLSIPPNYWLIVWNFCLIHY